MFSHGSEIWGALTWPYPCQQHTFIQDSTRSGLSLVPTDWLNSILRHTWMVCSFVHPVFLLLLSSPFSLSSPPFLLCPSSPLPHLTLKRGVTALHTWLLLLGNNVLYELLWIGCGLLAQNSCFGALVLNAERWWSLQEVNLLRMARSLATLPWEDIKVIIMDPSSCPWIWPTIK